ncbi:MAG: 3-methyl-2-oxobutanoate hydroxymethyltransferase [Paludibacteraceae bacterium]|nr:3-methyl-2-oxobutanoate hydroxymethyltransferase [Paludibacteraceae bacterium]
MSVHSAANQKITTVKIQQMADNHEKISVVTAYDFTMASLVERSGIDIILVGDSASNVMQGNSTTLPITVDEMITYAKTVVRACSRTMVGIDMPFGSYQGDTQLGLHNAVRMIKETGADYLKLEGGEDIIDTVQAIIKAGIPVMGHLGLTPQSVNKFGGYGLRAKEEKEAKELIKNAHMLEEAGCFSLVLEKIPAALAKQVADELRIPVIGIGAGNDVDGQVLVLQDMLGMNQGFKPKFLRVYANIGDQIVDALQRYGADVKSGDFPNQDESY